MTEKANMPASDLLLIVLPLALAMLISLLATLGVLRRGAYWAAIPLALVACGALLWTA